MFPAKIDKYVRPQSVADALSALAGFEEGDAIFLAGGQSAMQAIKSRMLRPECIVDLQDIAELKGIDAGGAGLTIGAMTRYVEIARATNLASAFAALADAAAHVGDRQVRNRGTIGGSVCWNYMASCLPTVVLGTNGTMNLVAADGGKRSVAADDFFLGPLETARESNEILTSITWDAPAANSGSAYKKWGLVTDALPVVGVCVSVAVGADGNCSSARVSLSGLADGGQRAPAAEAGLIGSDGGADAIAQAMAAAAEAADTHSDMSADADYRRQLIRSLGCEVAATAFARARAN
jgi:carbon-monoxide dehydrogenase medium subunit